MSIVLSADSAQAGGLRIVLNDGTVAFLPNLVAIVEKEVAELAAKQPVMVLLEKL